MCKVLKSITCFSIGIMLLTQPVMPTYASALGLDQSGYTELNEAQQTQSIIEEPKADETELLIEQPKADETELPIEQPKADETELPIEQPKADTIESPSEQPKVDDTKSIIETIKAEEGFTPFAVSADGKIEVINLKYKLVYYNESEEQGYFFNKSDFDMEVTLIVNNLLPVSIGDNSGAITPEVDENSLDTGSITKDVTDEKTEDVSVEPTEDINTATENNADNHEEKITENPVTDYNENDAKAILDANEINEGENKAKESTEESVISDAEEHPTNPVDKEEAKPVIEDTTSTSVTVEE